MDGLTTLDSVHQFDKKYNSIFKYWNAAKGQFELNI